MLDLLIHVHELLPRMHPAVEIKKQFLKNVESAKEN